MGRTHALHYYIHFCWQAFFGVSFSAWVTQSVFGTPAGPCVPTAKLMEKRSRICNFASLSLWQDKPQESDGLRRGWALSLLLYISTAWGVGFKPVSDLLPSWIFSSISLFCSLRSLHFPHSTKRSCREQWYILKRKWIALLLLAQLIFIDEKPLGIGFLCVVSNNIRAIALGGTA